MKMLFHEDDPKVKVHSSIDQYNKYIATYERGGWTPIEFDQLDYIKCADNCGKTTLVSHPIIIEFGDVIGYDFPIGECEFTTDNYPLFDKKEVETLPLPEEQGDGFYESYEDSQIIANFDDGKALGIRNNYKLKVGQDYFLADEILPSDDYE